MEIANWFGKTERQATLGASRHPIRVDIAAAKGIVPERIPPVMSKGGGSAGQAVYGIKTVEDPFGDSVKAAKVYQLVAFECATSLASRIESISRTGEYSSILADDGVAQANQLHRLLQRNEGRLFAVLPCRRRKLDRKTETLGLVALATWHWARYKALGSGPGDDDFFDALSLCEKLPEAAMMPPQVRTFIEGGGNLHALRAGYYNECASRYWREYHLTGQVDCLNQAIPLFSKAASALPSGHADSAMYQSNLSAALALWASIENSSSDLNRAVLLAKGAVEAASAADPQRSLYLSNYGNALTTMFLQKGSQGYINEAIKVQDEAVRTTPAGNPQLADRLSNLAASLRNRYELDRDPEDLERGLRAIRGAVEASSIDHPDQPIMLNNYANQLRSLFALTGKLSYLEEGIRAGEEAVSGTPEGRIEYAMHLSNHSLMLLARFSRTRKREDLERAVQFSGEAANATSPSNPRYLAHQTNRANALVARFLDSGDWQDIEDAIRCCDQAIQATQPDHPQLASCLSVYGGALLFRATGGNSAVDLMMPQILHPNPVFIHDLERSIECLRQAATHVTAPPKNRLEAAKAWGLCAMLSGNYDSGAEAYDTAVTLLPELAWHGLQRSAREGHLYEWSGLACDAAAACIIAGKSKRAVELLNLGRSIMWRQVLNLRTDLSAVMDKDHGLATKLVEVRDELDFCAMRLGNTSAFTEQVAILGETRGGHSTSHAGGVSIDEWNRLNTRRRELALQWDRLVEEARSNQGCENFLAATPFEDLRATLGTGGPVVIINVSEMVGCHALFITPDSDEVEVVSLAGVTAGSIAERAREFREVLQRSTIDDRTHLEREKDRHAFLDILEWIWRSVSEPILVALGHVDSPRAGGQVPRVWWCPTGALSTLPIHAAGIHSRSNRWPTEVQRTVSGRVISSYISTLAIGAQYKTRGKRRKQANVLAVGVSDASGVQSIPSVDEEMLVLGRCLPPRAVTYLRGAEATRGAVLSAIRDHNWVHFACHSVLDADSPWKSAFVLSDWKESPLTLDDLSSQQMPKAEMAFLSSCQTAVGDGRLIDESISLSAAMEVVGFRDVVATMWPILDSHAPLITEGFYRSITRDGERDKRTSPNVALALHGAIEQVRLAYPADPLIWSPYIHVGR